MKFFLIFSFGLILGYLGNYFFTNSQKVAVDSSIDFEPIRKISSVGPTPPKVAVTKKIEPLPEKLSEDQLALKALVSEKETPVVALQETNAPCNIEYHQEEELGSLFTTQKELTYLIEEKAKDEIKKSFESLSASELSALDDMRKAMEKSVVH
jgi:hypothetical protein